MDCAKCNGYAETGKHANSAQCAVFSTKYKGMQYNRCATKIFLICYSLQRKKEVEFRHGLRELFDKTVELGKFPSTC